MSDVMQADTSESTQVLSKRDRRGRFLVGDQGGAPPITADTARDMVRRREEKRIRLYTEGAGRAVQDTQLIREYGKDAHIVERGMTLQQIATTPDAGKAAVMAAQALDVAQGLIVKGKPETADGGVTFDDAQRDLIRDLAAIARAMDAQSVDAASSSADGAQADDVEVIDADGE